MAIEEIPPYSQFIVKQNSLLQEVSYGINFYSQKSSGARLLHGIDRPKGCIPSLEGMVKVSTKVKRLL